MNAIGRRFIAAGPAICLVAVCAREPGPTRSPVLEQVILAPASANVVGGGSQQFTVSGRMSDGSSVAIAATYAATGGAITRSGLYFAGSVTGTYQVIATDSGERLADTADVTVTGLGAHNYTTSFPLTEDPISEGGHWINGGAVGEDWTNVSTTPGLAIGHQVGASYTDATAILNGVWRPDQAASATVHAVSQNDACYQEVELRLRSAVSAHVNRGYEVSYKSSQTPAAYLIIVRWNGGLGDFTYLFNQTSERFGVKEGDAISASVVGNVITAYKNGVQMAQVTDDNFTTGNPGMGFNLESGPAGCAGTNGNYGFTSYTATDDAGTAMRLNPTSVVGEPQSRPRVPPVRKEH